jgi:bifunctional DNA-binding transcriptional regulator/antitoxin component of YhaV-PrlF toxin-antitoxin module
MVTRMREKGQVTIPVDIRRSLKLSRDSVLSVAKVGSGILLSLRASLFEATSERFSKAASEKGITLAALLKELKRIRRADS